MSSIRITQGLLVQRTLNNLTRSLERLSVLQEQLATGLRVNAPSDDPIAARRAVNTRTTMQKNNQYLRNIESIAPKLTGTETCVSTALEVLQRAQELTIQGATGTNSQPQLDSIASEINQLIEEMLVQANHKTSGNYVFGGTRTLNEPFEAARDADGEITGVAYNGNDRIVSVAISDGITIGVNEPGSKVFLSNQDVFQILIDIRDSLRAGDQASLQNDLLGDLNDAAEQLHLSLARVGAVQNRLNRSTTNIEEFNAQLEVLLSDTIDADYAETILNLNAQSNAYQAALNAGARVIQPSLLNFIS